MRCYKIARNFTNRASLLCSVAFVFNRSGDSGSHLGLTLVEMFLFPYWESYPGTQCFKLGRLGHYNCTVITEVAKLQFSTETLKANWKFAFDSIGNNFFFHFMSFPIASQGSCSQSQPLGWYIGGGSCRVQAAETEIKKLQR